MLSKPKKKATGIFCENFLFFIAASAKKKQKQIRFEEISSDTFNIFSKFFFVSPFLFFSFFVCLVHVYSCSFVTEPFHTQLGS